MILGILDADTLRDDLQSEYVSYAQMMIQLFEQLPDLAIGINNKIEFKSFHVRNGVYPAHMDECDAYLITGSKSSAYDDEPWIHDLSDYIKTLYQQNKKMLGICFGHQLIAQSLGGKTQLAPQGWGIGVHSYAVNPNAEVKKILPDLKNGFSLLVSHRDQVTIIPPQAQKVASSEFCPNAAYMISNKVLCFQGHPEFTPAYANALMQARKDIIEPNVFEKGQACLHEQTQHLSVAKSMLAFVGMG